MIDGSPIGTAWIQCLIDHPFGRVHDRPCFVPRTEFSNPIESATIRRTHRVCALMNDRIVIATVFPTFAKFADCRSHRWFCIIIPSINIYSSIYIIDDNIVISITVRRMIVVQTVKPHDRTVDD